MATSQLVRMDKSIEERQLALIDEVRCPVCSKAFDDLFQLNYHLDTEHGFNDSEDSSGKILNNNGSNMKESTAKKSKEVHKMDQITRTHWKKPLPGKQTCHECQRLLSKSTGMLNCRKCGELFCKVHCANVVRLNFNAEYDPQGKWANCCYKCFSNKPGYNDFGSLLNLTDQFQKLRHKRNEDKQLRKLQLENRLVRLIDGITRIVTRNSSSIIMTYKVSKEISSLERTITPWKDDRSVFDCYICLRPFGLTLRKHHCRVCGNIVCDSGSTNCSNEVPLSNLVNAANDLPFKEYRQEIVKNEYSLRICSNCIHTLYVERKFKKDSEKPLSALLSRCESMYNISQVISNILPAISCYLKKIEEARESNVTPSPKLINESTKLRMKLSRAVESYNVLTRQISNMPARNDTEKRIQQSFQISSSIFINEKLLKLRALPSFNKLDIKEVQKEITPETHKLSDIVFNNLTIKEVKKYREELMVLKEQKFLVESMIESSKKQRKFDELTLLMENLSELERKIQEIQRNLGDQGFS